MIKTVVFDLGGVLIDWDPRHLYRKLIPEEAAMERFLDEVCNDAWNVRQDAGRTIDEAVAERVTLYPDHTPLIEAYYDRWLEMVPGAIDGTVEILAELKALGTPLYALTNFSRETFPLATERFEFFGWFEGVVVSGRVGVIKPDRRIYDLLFTTFDIAPSTALFIDDRQDNVDGAKAAGMDAVRFSSPERLRADLRERGIL